MSRHGYNCRGQATAEVVISLVGLTVVFFGLLQIARLGHESIQNLMEARRRSEVAMGAIGTPIGEYVRNWTDGGDALSFTADDEAVHLGGATIRFTDVLAQPVALDKLENNPAYGMSNSFTPLLAPGSLAPAADLREGRSTRVLDVEAALRLLVFSSLSHVRLDDKVYMPGIHLAPP